MRTLLIAAALGVASFAIVSCSKPRDLGGQYTGIGAETATFDRGGKVDNFTRAPMNETVTVMRGAGTAFRIRYGSCELPATATADGSGAKIDTGATCTVNGVAAIPMSGTFNDIEGVAGGLSVLVVGGGPTADGKTTYSYKFTGTRLPR
jgi:hypothetical protein